jgi:hypothetical protein
MPLAVAVAAPDRNRLEYALTSIIAGATSGPFNGHVGHSEMEILAGAPILVRRRSSLVAFASFIQYTREAATSIVSCTTPVGTSP